MKRLPGKPLPSPNPLIQEMQRNMSIAAAKREAIQKRIKQSKQASVDSMVLNGLVDVYTNQVPYELDILRSNLYSKVDIGWFIRTVLGTGLNNPLWVNGFSCTPVSPPGLSVDVAPGVLYNFDVLLPVDYSVIPADADPDHEIYKPYISFDAGNFSTPAPTTPGNSVIHLIQVAHEEKAVNDVNRPYYNSADPQDPIFETQPDTLQTIAIISRKLGVEGVSPVAPTPDPGCTALYRVTVTYGQTSIISGNITVAPGAPFITESLTQKIGTADLAGYLTIAQFQNSSPAYVVATGATNTLAATPSPAYGAYQDGMRIFVKANATITGASTLNVSGHGAVAIQVGGQPTLRNEILINRIYEFVYNSTGPAWELINPEPIAIVCQVSLSSSHTFIFGANRLIPWNAVDDDVFSLFSGASNYEIILPRAGRWEISGLVSCSTFPAPGQDAGFIAYHNGSQYKFLDDIGALTNQAPALGGSTSLNAAIGDTIQAYIVFTASNTDLGGAGSVQNYFTVSYKGK